MKTAAVAEGRAELRPVRDGRLVPYGLVAVAGLAGALVAGQPAFAALAAPFVLALALGLRRTGPVTVDARLVIDSAQLLEGDALTGRLEVRWQGELDARALLHRLTGVEPFPGTGEPAWTATSATSIEGTVRLRAARWGRHALGEVWLRLEAPFGLVSWTGKVLDGPAVRVLPGSERLDRLLDPAECRAVWGVHRSRRLGEGHEFAELRPYVPGDRLRDLNWAASARYGRPIVNRHHPDLSSEVVIALDAPSDGWAGSAAALSRAARAAWAMASVHLRANDRVGLVGLGGSTRWLPPAGGRLARYRLLETLLRIGGEAAERVTRPSASRWTALPRSASIILLTTLHDRAAVAAVERWRARGRAVAAVVIETRDLLEPPRSTAEALAVRVWELRLAERKRALARLGVPWVTAPVDGPLTPALSALGRARSAPSAVAFRRPARAPVAGRSR